MSVLAKNTQKQRDDEDNRLVRPSPREKPPRRDLRREHVETDDPDDDDASDRKDRSRNYKNIGGSLRDRLIQRVTAAKDRIPAKSRETGETVMISPDTLKEQPGKYEAVKDEEEPESEPSEPAEPSEKTPEKGEKPSNKEERDAYYQKAGDKLRGLSENDPRLQSKLERFKDPNSEIAQLAKENPDLPAAKLFPGVALPEELKTIGDVNEAMSKAPSPKKKPKKESPAKAEAPAPKEPKSEKPEPAKPEDKKPEKPKDKAETKSEKPEEGEKPEPTAAQKAGIPEPERRPVNAAEREEALTLLVDTFPPHISAELIAKNLHPDDVHTLVRDYTAATKDVHPDKLDTIVSKAGSFFQPDPTKVEPPTVGKNAAGERVSFDQLTPEEQAEATRKHQLQVAALSLAAQHMLTDKLASKGALTGKDRIPRSLASTLANMMLTGTPADTSNHVAADTYDTTLKSGSEQSISDKAAHTLLGQVKNNPAAHAAAKAYLQANDYGVAKRKFLKGDDDTLSEWQSPRELLKGLAKAGRFFDDRNALYGEEGATHPSSTYFRARVMSRLRTLDPKKARVVAAKLPELEEQEYKDRHRKWEARHKKWESENQSHEQAVEQYMEHPGKKPPGTFTAPEPQEPQEPPSVAAKKDTSDVWDSVLKPAPASNKPAPAKKPVSPEAQLDPGEKKEVAQAVEKAVENPPKLASDFTYPATLVMGTANRTGVYHGVDPYAHGPMSYPGWLQPLQRDFSAQDFEAIVGMAQDWLKSPLLTVATDGLVPDARYRAALDLAIYDSPYNGGVSAVRYNQLLAKLAGLPEPGKGETLLTIRKEAQYSFKTETRYLLAHGSTPITREVLAAVEAATFPFNDEEGASREGGTVTARVLKQGSTLTERQASDGLVPETVLRVDFPEGSEGAALKAVQASLSKFALQVEKTTPGYLPTLRKKASSDDTSTFSPTPSDSTGGSTPMKASSEIRKFATKAASVDSKLAFELTAFADRLAEEEKKGLPPWLKDKVKGKDDKDDKGDEEKKEAAKMASLRTLIIKQAASLDAPARAAWMPVLQALKDLK